MQTSVRPDLASWSTKVAAKSCVTLPSAMATLTLLHGFSQSGASWDELASLLPAGLDVIAPDLRGHGAKHPSAGEPHTLSAATEDVLRGWDELGLRRSHLVGYSLGGRLALHLAANHPERVETLAVISAHAGFE